MHQEGGSEEVITEEGDAEEVAEKEVKKTAEKVISDFLLWYVVTHLNWLLF